MHNYNFRVNKCSFTCYKYKCDRKNIKASVDKKLKKIEDVENELSSIKQLMALMAFCEMDEKDQSDFIDSIKKEVAKYDDKRNRTE